MKKHNKYIFDFDYALLILEWSKEDEFLKNNIPFEGQIINKSNSRLKNKSYKGFLILKIIKNILTYNWSSVRIKYVIRDLHL